MVFLPLKWCYLYLSHRAVWKTPWTDVCKAGNSNDMQISGMVIGIRIQMIYICSCKNKTSLTWEIWEYIAESYQKKKKFHFQWKYIKEKKKKLIWSAIGDDVVHKWLRDVAGKHNLPLFYRLVSLQRLKS